MRSLFRSPAPVPSVKFPLAMRILHWLMAAIILGMIAVGWYMHGLEDTDPSRETLYALHKSFGVTVLALVTLRVVLRFTTRIPPLPATLPRLELLAARVAHLLLYAFMFAVPLSGFTMSAASGFGVKWFGIPLPNPIGTDRALAEFAHNLHGILPYILLAVIVLHAVGAVKHRLFDAPENDVISRMTFSK